MRFCHFYNTAHLPAIEDVKQKKGVHYNGHPFLFYLKINYATAPSPTSSCFARNSAI